MSSESDKQQIGIRLPAETVRKIDALRGNQSRADAEGIDLRQWAAATIVAGAALGLTGCQRGGDPPLPAVTPSPSPAAQAQPAVAPDTTPKASELFREGSPPSVTSTNSKPVDPSHALSREEESTAMPLPGQANDHSTLAKDSGKR